MKILVYHHIDQRSAYRQSSASKGDENGFERQMDYLYRHHYRCISLTDYLEAPEGKQWPDKSFVLTFDDGYEDFYTVAFPVLKRLQLTATVFLVTDLVGKTSQWIDEQGAELMSWEQVKELERSGITFGSHTCHHCDLSKASREEMIAELRDSKQSLERALTQPLNGLAYPYGKSTEEVQAACREAGYQAALGSATGKPNRYNLWRVACDVNDSEQAFAYQLSPLFDVIKSLRRWAREDTLAGPAVRKIRQSLGSGR